MSHVVIINGPAGVGKTTITGILAPRLPGTVNVAGDDILHFAPADARAYLGPGSTYRAGGTLVKAYLEMNAPRVLFNYVFTEPSHVGAFCRWLAPATPVHLFTIWAPFDIVQQREATRPGREPLGARVLETYRALEQNLGDLGNIVANTGTPEDTVGQIIGIIGKRGGVPAGHFAS